MLNNPDLHRYARQIRMDEIGRKGQAQLKAAGTGINANAVMMIDPYLRNVSLQDPLDASVVFYDSPVRLIKEKSTLPEKTLVYD